MNNKNILLFLLLTPLCLHTQIQQVTTFISPRSQGIDLARILVGWEHAFHRPDKKELYGTSAIVGQASTTFRTERINQCLFGEDIIKRGQSDTEWKDFITISGSETSNRIPGKDWLADYFGLPTDFKSLVRFRPRVNTFLLDLQTFIGLNNIAQGLYVQFEFPFVYTNWDINIKEAIIQSGKNNYAPGYFNAAGVERENLLKCFSSFISGNQAPEINDSIFHKLKYAKISTQSHRLARFAELRTSIGYDHFIKNIHHMGLAAHIAAPCGNRARARFLFEPLVGNGGHWELGAEFTGHFRTWEKDDTEEKTDFYYDILITHFFKNTQKRSFDLKKKPNSRYMIAQKMTPVITDNITGNNTTPIGQFAHEYTPIANLTTFDTTININAQADLTVMYSYTKKRNVWSFGYGLWKRGCENITLNNPHCFEENTWAIKGDAHLFGFIAQSTEQHDLPINTAVALSATESKATINSGTNFPKTGISSNPEKATQQIATAARNPHIDFPQLAFAGNNQPLVASPNDTTPINSIGTSIQPYFITLQDIDINSAQTSGFSQKIFAHLNHAINSKKITDSYIGIGGEIEFGRQAGPTPVIGADKCINCALSYWTAWIKGGVSF